MQIIQAVGFPTPDFGWVLDGNGRLLISDDGGAAWAPQPLPQPTFCILPQIFGFAGPGTGWASVSGKGCDTPLVRTSDQGATWVAPAAIPAGRILSAAYAPSGAGWAVVGPPGRTGDVLLERDPAGGGPWTPVTDLGPFQWPVSGPAPAWVGATLTIDPAGGLWLGDLRSADGGRTWTAFTAVAGSGPNGGGAPGPYPMEFASPQVGWAQVGDGLYQTKDGGTKWAEVSFIGTVDIGGAS